MSDRSIHINACVFGRRFVVSIEPRTVDQPSRDFREIGPARVYAGSVSHANGWPIMDNSGEEACG